MTRKPTYKDLEQKIRILEESIKYNRTQEELPENEANYRLLVDNSHDLIWTLTADGVFTFVSPSWQRALGYEPSYIIGRSFQDIIHPDDVARCEDYLHKAIRGIKKKLPVPEYRVRHANGSWQWHAARGTPVFAADGSFIYFIGISRDVTERKFTEDALKESQQKFSNIIDFLPDATFVIDKEGKVIAWNRAIEEMTGIKAADMLDHGNYEYALPFYGERRPILIDLVLKPREDIEARYIKKERRNLVLEAEAYIPALRGGNVYLYGRASILRDSKGNIVGAIESIRDVTARRQAEDKYKAIFENAVMGIYQATPKGRIINTNPAFARILGYASPEEVVRMVTDIPRQLYVHPEQRAELMHTLKTYGTIQNQEINLFRKDRSIVWVTLNGIAVKDVNGKLIYYEGSVQDITEHKSLELQLRQTQKMEAIGTLAGGIAHDFNNILSAVIGYAEMALGEPKMSGSLRHYLGQIYKAGMRAGELVNQILTFSRQDDEKLYPLKISPIVKEAVKLLRSSLPSTIEIRRKIQSDPDIVITNPTHIHQILMNLCTNAAHAMGAGKGILDVGLAPVTIEPGDALIHQDLMPGMYIKLSVSDTGHGINTGIIDKIFDPFFTTKKPGEGTGMGLSVVHGIVKRCGGTITVQSKVGKGTEFDVYFPLLTETDGERQKKEATVHIVGGKECILFIDDEEALIDIGRKMLISLGYKVLAMTKSPEALELFRTRPDRFDLVITDMTMPRMTGLELAQELMLIRPDIPVILCTGFSEHITPERATSLGMRDFIMKPIELNQIAASIRRVLDKKDT